MIPTSSTEVIINEGENKSANKVMVEGKSRSVAITQKGGSLPNLLSKCLESSHRNTVIAPSTEGPIFPERKMAEINKLC